MDFWPFWMLEENVKLVNEIIEEEENQRKSQEAEQSGSMPDHASTMRNMASSMPNMSNFKMPSL